MVEKGTDISRFRKMRTSVCVRCGMLFFHYVTVYVKALWIDALGSSYEMEMLKKSINEAMTPNSIYCTAPKRTKLPVLNNLDSGQLNCNGCIFRS